MDPECVFSAAESSQQVTHENGPPPSSLEQAGESQGQQQQEGETEESQYYGGGESMSEDKLQDSANSSDYDRVDQDNEVDGADVSSMVEERQVNPNENEIEETSCTEENSHPDSNGLNIHSPDSLHLGPMKRPLENDLAINSQDSEKIPGSNVQRDEKKLTDDHHNVPLVSVEAARDQQIQHDSVVYERVGLEPDEEVGLELDRQIHQEFVMGEKLGPEPGEKVIPEPGEEVGLQQNEGVGLKPDLSTGRKVSSSDGSDDDFFDAEDRLEELNGEEPALEDALKFQTAREGDLLLWEQSLTEAARAKDAGTDQSFSGTTEDKSAKTPVGKRNSDLWGTFEPDSVVLVDKNSREGQRVPSMSGGLSTVSSSTSSISQQSAPSGRTDWIQFEEGPTKRSHSSMGGMMGPSSSRPPWGDHPTSSRTDWVRFETSPRAKRRQISQQFTGDSIANSIDAMSSDGRSVAEFDRLSAATPSVLSSHGSYSDYQEYVPLDSSSTASVGRAPEKASWSEQRSFDDMPVAPPRRKSASFMNYPPEPSTAPHTRSIPSPIPPNWVQFEGEVGLLGANNPPSNDKPSFLDTIAGVSNPAEVRLASRSTLPSRTILATNIASLPSEATYPDAGDQPVHNTVSAPITVPPSPANPFREDIIRHQRQQESRISNHRRQGSYNPFQADIPEESLQAPSTWQTFSDDYEQPVAAPSSPGNPFRFTATVELHQPFHREQAGQASQSPHRNCPVDETDFAYGPSTTAVLHQATAEYGLVSTEPRSSQYIRTLPTATVAPVIKDVEKSASVLPEEVKVASLKDYINEYPRRLEDPEQGWPLMLRYPDKKKIAGSREWKPVHVRLIEGSLLQFFDSDTDTEPFKEIPLQCNYEFTPLKLYPYDTMGQIHTIKLLYTTYREKWKLSARGFHSRVLDIEQLLKVGSRNYENFRGFVFVVNEALVRLSSSKSSGSHYHNDSVTVTVSDSYRNLMSTKGDLLKQSVHVDIYMLAFLSGKSECAIGLNDVQVKGTEVVSKRDIIPNKTTEWIKMENIELHRCCNKNVFVESRFITFDPIDACRFKLLSFDLKPKANPELPLLVKASLSGEDVHIQFRVDLLVPSRGPKQEPHHYICYDIMVRIPVPPSLVAFFRHKKRIGFASVKAVNKTAEQIKKPRIKPNLLEVSVGSAKYEHAFEAIVWRIDKLPEKMAAVPVTHLLLCTLNLKSGRNYSAARLAIPSEFQDEVKVDYRTHHTTASRTAVRSLAIDSDKPPDKIVRYSAQYEYTVLVENTYVMGPSADGVDDPQCVQQ